jgi:hypothetical protein
LFIGIRPLPTFLENITQLRDIAALIRSEKLSDSIFGTVYPKRITPRFTRRVRGTSELLNKQRNRTPTNLVDGRWLDRSAVKALVMPTTYFRYFNSPDA